MMPEVAVKNLSDILYKTLPISAVLFGESSGECYLWEETKCHY